MSEPVEDVVERSSSDVESGGIDVLEMVGVKPVRGEEEWEEEDDPPILSEYLEHADELRFPGWVLHHDDMRSVFALNEERIAEKHGKNEASGHQDDESDIGSIIDLAAFVVKILPKGNESSNDTAQVENPPENGDEATLLSLKRVCHHHCTLRAPEKTGADTEEAAREDEEAGVLGVVVAQDCCYIYAVSDTAESKSQSKTDPIGDAAGEESDDRECGIDSDVGSVDIVRVE